MEGPEGLRSLEHQLHGGASALVFLAVPVAALVSALGAAGAWRWVSFGAATTGLGLLAAFSVAWVRDTARSGLVQRGMVLANWTWVALLGVRVLGRTGP